jgi:hypothetical protein
LASPLKKSRILEAISAASVLTEGIWAHAVALNEAATSRLGAIATASLRMDQQLMNCD